MFEKVEIETLSLFPLLNKQLIHLLEELTAEEWKKPTVATQWNVKDIAAHLLDGCIRGLSISRDGHMAETPTINSYADLVQFINNQNKQFVETAKRISTGLLIELLATTTHLYTQHLQRLPPFEPAVFSVAWAGHTTSPNWFHIAREYTEQFLHQQQIRDAVGKQGIMTHQFFYPFIQTFMYALPYNFLQIPANNNTTIEVKILTDIGGTWHITKTSNDWQLFTGLPLETPISTVSIPPNIAWKLFSKSMPVSKAIEFVTIEGDYFFGQQVLQTVAVMA